MGYDVSTMTLIEKIQLAFSVAARWEVWLTLLVFLALFLFARFVAEPWRSAVRKASAAKRAARRKADKERRAADAAKQPKAPEPLIDEDENEDERFIS